MNIARVDTFPLLYRLPKPYGDANGYKKYRTCYLIRVTTQSGLTGWGECIDWLPTLAKGFEQRIIPFLLGKLATDRLQLVKTISKWHQRAAAAVSMALTELLAKQAGLTVCQLWGGSLRDRVPVYASFQSYTDDPQWERHSLRMVIQAAASGFAHAKVKIGGRSIAEDQRHITLLQNELGSEVRIALDANQSYDLAAVRAWRPLLERWDNYMWLEEPMPLDRVREYKLLRGTLPIPVAGGENLQGGKAFLPLLSEGGLDIIQPDTMHTDGLDGFRETLALARHFGLRASPHAFDGALSRLYALFALACLPPWSKMDGEAIEPVEWDAMDNPFSALLPVQPSGGEVKLPEGPGIGVEMDLERVESLRWDGATYI